LGPPQHDPECAKVQEAGRRRSRRRQCLLKGCEKPFQPKHPQARYCSAAGKKVADAKFVKVWQNGVLIHENADLPGPTRSSLPGPEAPTGQIMLQGDHGPVAYRNIWIEPLKLD